VSDEYHPVQGYGSRHHPRIFIVVAAADEHPVLREAVVGQHIPHQEAERLFPKSSAKQPSGQSETRFRRNLHPQ